MAVCMFAQYLRPWLGRQQNQEAGKENTEDTVWNKMFLREPRKKSELITEKCIWETSKKKGDSFYMKSHFNGKKT
jgi:hypothetical protein